MRHKCTFRPASWVIGWLLGMVLTFLTTQAAEAATLRLGPDCGPTIQDCVLAAFPGDTILVPPKKGKGKPNDAYYENVVVDIPLTIRGTASKTSRGCLDPRQAFDDLGRLRRNKTAVILDAAPGGDPGGDGFFVLPGAAGTTIECFAVRHGERGVHAFVSTDATVSKVAAIGQNDAGLLFFRSDRFQVLDNLVIGAERGMILTSDDGLLRGNWVRSTGADCIGMVGANLTLVDNHVRRCGNFGFSNILVDAGAPDFIENTADVTRAHGFGIICFFACPGGSFRGNTASNNDLSGFTVGSTGGLEVSGNRAFKNRVSGFELFGDDMVIRGNVAERNGAGGDVVDGHGFLVEGSRNVLLANAARFNKRGGFILGGDDNVLGDGTNANRNLAERNLVDGFDVEVGTGNTLDNNLARNNEGEGIENNAADTLITANRSVGNRLDCANSGTLDPGSGGNDCDDGSDFAEPPEVERQHKPDMKQNVEQARERARAEIERIEAEGERLKARAERAQAEAEQARRRARR